VKGDPELVLVEQVSNIARRDPIRRLQDTVRRRRPLRSDANGTEGRELHHVVKPPRAVSQELLGNLTRFTVDELCDKIRSTPELSSMPIGDLFRREMPTGFQHEFILIKSAAVAGPSVWIRIDRAAKGYHSGRPRTRYPANDTVSTLAVRSCGKTVSDTLQALMGGDENHGQMVGKSRLRAHVVFPGRPDRPSFLTLAELVMVMHDESRDYRLLSVGCMIQPASSTMHSYHQCRRTVTSSRQ
jgi:hypothetical protein